ncbi:MAG TPA: RodZ domain-containing protein [Chloroflexia bacterium]|nr:RodZ domain-containing protein [Chloroflexia bacterium]
MATLGEVLRTAREARRISLDEAERGTKIRQKYLSALEDDNMAALPGPVYARGFVRNYASYLELDVDEVMELYDGARQPTRERIKTARGGAPTRGAAKPDQEKISIQPLSSERIDTRVRYGSQYIALSLLAIPMLIVFYFIYSAYAGPQSQPPPTPVIAIRPPTITPLAIGTLTAVAGGPNSGSFNTPTVLVPSTAVLGAQQTVTGTTVAGGALTGTATVAIPAGNKVTLKVDIIGNESWMSVTLDGVEQFKGSMAIGTTRQWTANNNVLLWVGRADSVRVTVNGVDRGFMGTAANLVVKKKWDKNGNEQVVP